MAQKPVQPTLGYRSVKTLTTNGFSVKDLNKNGKLDKYEDWRLPTEQRVPDLIGRMTIEEKIGFMLISTTRLAGDASFQQGAPKSEITSGFNEEDLVQNMNMFTQKPLPYPMMMAAGTTKGLMQNQLRHFILRANTSAKTMAGWSNNLRALCESSRLGIPAIVASNPRNHITADASIGLSVGTTIFSKWPGELGLSAMHDLKLTRKFADIARQEWAAVGLRKGYQYMADLATEPRWQRIEGTLGEDADWTADMTHEIVLGLFENPYVDPELAQKTVGKPEFQQRADLALRKSIVLLRNSASLLPLAPKTKVYMESYSDNGRTKDPITVLQPTTHTGGLQFVATKEDADILVVGLLPNSGSLFSSNGAPIELQLSKNKVDVAHINALTSQKSIVLLINFTDPWVIDKIDNANLKTVLATFGTTTDAVLDVLSGAFKPTGKMPFTSPISRQAVLNNQSDVPGHMKPKGYALFTFGDGLSYQNR